MVIDKVAHAVLAGADGDMVPARSFFYARGAGDLIIAGGRSNRNRPASIARYLRDAAIADAAARVGRGVGIEGELELAGERIAQRQPAKAAGAAMSNMPLADSPQAGQKRIGLPRRDAAACPVHQRRLAQAPTMAWRELGKRCGSDVVAD